MDTPIIIHFMDGKSKKFFVSTPTLYGLKTAMKKYEEVCIEMTDDKGHITDFFPSSAIARVEVYVPDAV